MKRLSLLLTATLAALMLIGCGHENPLNKLTPEQETKVLMSASQKAEKTLNLFVVSGAEGYFYLSCLKGHEQKESCDKLYSEMLGLIKKNKNLETVQLADVTDKKLVSRITDIYLEELNKNLPRGF